MLVRAMRDDDDDDVARLATELGYPSRTEEIRARRARLGASDALLVAELDGEVVGFVHARPRLALVADEVLEVAALVRE